MFIASYIRADDETFKGTYLTTEHDCELLGHTLPSLLDSSGVANEGCRHLETLRRDVANGCLDVVRNPLNKVGRVLVHNVQHLLIDFLR